MKKIEFLLAKPCALKLFSIVKVNASFDMLTCFRWRWCVYHWIQLNANFKTRSGVVWRHTSVFCDALSKDKCLELLLSSCEFCGGQLGFQGTTTLDILLAPDISCGAVAAKQLMNFNLFENYLLNLNYNQLCIRLGAMTWVL